MYPVDWPAQTRDPMDTPEWRHLADKERLTWERGLPAADWPDYGDPRLDAYLTWCNSPGK